MSPEQRKQRRSRRDELRTLLNEWDPAGVLAGGGARDVYDPLADGLLDRLLPNSRESEIEAYLATAVKEHFSADARDAGRFAAKVLAWNRMGAEETS